MTRRPLWPLIRRIWITLGIGATIVFAGWSLVAYRASAAARRALNTDDRVAVTREHDAWSFTPRATAQRTALVFFPGALVDPVAYAPLVRAAAEAGFPAHLIELPRRGAFGGADDPAVEQRLERVLTGPGMPRQWVVAGHSRGAVVASRVAAERREGMDGLVVIGSSHPRDVDLSGLPVAVTKIVGTRDGLASPAEVEANRAKLPPGTRWVWVEGANHSQFGWYGFQPGDRRATITADSQRTVMVRAVLEALARASSAPGS